MVDADESDRFPGRLAFSVAPVGDAGDVVAFAIDLSDGAANVHDWIASGDADRVHADFFDDSGSQDARFGVPVPALWYRRSDAAPFRPAVRYAMARFAPYQAVAYDIALAMLGFGWRARARAMRRSADFVDRTDFEAAWSDPALRRDAALADNVAIEVREDARGVFEVARDESELLAKEGIGSVEEGLAYRGGTSLRKLRDRENVRIDASGFRSGERRYFMKRFPARRVGLPFVSRRQRTRARDEWENTRLVRSTGWGTAALGAIGEARPVGRGASFVIMGAIDDAVPLDDVLAELARTSSSDPRRMRTEVRSMIVTLAGLVAALHRAGAYHKDLYLCHVLVRGAGDRREWFLIDLDRLRWRRHVRSRWFVKDLAALHHSADAAIVSRTDRLRFVRRYLRRHARLGDERRLIARVLRKAARMGSHVPRHR